MGSFTPSQILAAAVSPSMNVGESPSTFVIYFDSLPLNIP